MADELSLKKKQQMEAIKLMADWSKWLITIETAGVGGILSLIKFADYAFGMERLWSFGASAVLFVAAFCFLFSILNACLLVFSLPSIVEKLHTVDPLDLDPKAGIDTMQDQYFPHPIIVYEARQYKSFFAGLVAIAVALAVWMARGVWGILH